MAAEIEADKRVCFIHSPSLLRCSDRNPRYTGRAGLVYSLIEAYGLLQHMRVVCPKRASKKQLQGFHSNEYINFLETHSNQSDSSDDEEEAEEFGLGYDCPLFTGCYDYMCEVGGAGLTSADLILSDDADIVINWYGGWHHAKRDGASGYCYCNDIVLTILSLQTLFSRILYIDIDIHHGDGVEEAFWYSSKVLNISFHHFSPGFFPGTGDIGDIGGGRGKYYTVNVPLLEGARDQQYNRVFRDVVERVREIFQPQCLVVQCGGDILSGDPLGQFNLTVRGVAQCIDHLLQWSLPTVLLGGGGYNFPNTARLWTLCTALTVGHSLHDNIPDHQLFPQYGPDYQLHTTPGMRTDKNTDQYITSLTDTLLKNISCLSKSS